MSLLGMVDNLGGGLISPLISYWFFLRYGVELKSLGFMFFLSYFLAAMSFLTAPIIARQIGVVRTMAFSHGLASLTWLCLPFAPTFTIAATLTIIRSYLAYMDNPLRSSFIMGVVRPEDRGSAAGFTTLSRHVPVAISPSHLRLHDAGLCPQRADLDRRWTATVSRLRFLLHVPRRQTAGRTRSQAPDGQSLNHGNRQQPAPRRQTFDGLARYPRLRIFIFERHLRHLSRPPRLHAGHHRHRLLRRLFERRGAHRLVGLSVGSLRTPQNPDAAGALNDRLQRHLRFF